MKFVGYVASNVPYFDVCECTASGKLRRLSRSSSFDIDPSDVTGVSGLKNVGNDKSTILKIYSGPLPIHPRWYELPLGTCRSGDLSVAPSRREEHDARNTIRLYKDTVREDAMEFGDPNIRALAQQELNIAERIAAYNSCDLDKVARIDEREEQRRKWKAYHRSVRKYHAGISKASSSKGK